MKYSREVLHKSVDFLQLASCCYVHQIKRKLLNSNCHGHPKSDRTVESSSEVKIDQIHVSKPKKIKVDVNQLWKPEEKMFSAHKQTDQNKREYLQQTETNRLNSPSSVWPESPQNNQRERMNFRCPYIWLLCWLMRWVHPEKKNPSHDPDTAHNFLVTLRRARDLSQLK